MGSSLQEMIDKQVVVKTGDVVYRGRLVEISEEAVCLMAKPGWREVPMERIVAIDLIPEQEETVEPDHDLI